MAVQSNRLMDTINKIYHAMLFIANIPKGIINFLGEIKHWALNLLNLLNQQKYNKTKQKTCPSYGMLGKSLIPKYLALQNPVN